MKFYYTILILTILLWEIKANAQDLNRKDLMTQLKADKKALIVINGLAFSPSDSLKIDSLLNKIDNKKISEITILKNDGKISHQRNDVIIIQYATEDPPKKIIKTNIEDSN